MFGRKRVTPETFKYLVGLIQASNPQLSDEETLSYLERYYYVLEENPSLVSVEEGG